MMKKILFVIVFFFTTATHSFANQYLNGLYREYHCAKTDTTKYNLLYKIIQEYVSMERETQNPVAISSILNRTIEELRTKKDLHRLGLFLGLKAEACIITKKYDLGDQYCDSCIQIAEKFQDYAFLGSVFWLKKLVYQKMNLRERMVNSLYKAVENYKMAGNVKREAELLFELGCIYEDTEQNDLAIKIFLKCADLTKDKLLAGVAYLFISKIFMKTGNLKLAEDYIVRGRPVIYSPVPSQSFYYFFLYGRWLKAMNRKEEALYNLKIAGLFAVKGKHPDQHAMVLCEMVEIFIDEKIYPSAEKMLDEAKSIAYRENFLDRKIDVHRVFSNYYAAVGEPSKTLKEYKTWQVLKDSQHQNELSRALTRSVKESDYNRVEAKRAESQRKKDEKEAQKLRRQKLMVYSTGMVLLFMGFISFILYRSNRHQKTANAVIAAEKKRSDDLLHNILPEEVALELKLNGATKAKEFHEVTVLFTDFKNFTAVSERLTAQQLVNEINFYYSAFDNIITRYGIEKIKTIGDSYMCAGGLPVENLTNPQETVQAALDMRDFTSEEKQKRIEAELPYFEIRIGLHSGPVVAGIVGTKKFAYDIWGDTVNIASRMESSGEPGKVNISSSTYELVKDIFTCQHRGKIQAKNKGMIDMYFVERPK